MNNPIHQPNDEPERPSLRLYRGNDSKHESWDDPSLRRSEPPRRRGRKTATLREVFERSVKPKLESRGRAKCTIGDIDRAIKRWESYWRSQQNCKARMYKGQRTLYPLLTSRVKVGHLDKFQQHLLSSGLSASTVNGYMGSIRQILIAADRLGLMRRRPMAEKLPETAAPKWYLQTEQIDRLMHCAAAQTWPDCEGLSAGDWWRCWLVLMWTYGFRTQELFAFEPAHHGLKWDAFRLHTETPNPQGTATNALGWLVYTPQKQEWAKPQPLYLPLTHSARWAVDRLLCNRDLDSVRAELVFPWPHSARSFYGHWRKWQDAAEVRNKAGRRFRPKHLRKTASTYLDTHYRGLGGAVLGHDAREGSNVNTKHYTVDEMTLVERLASYPVPESFSLGLQVPQASTQVDFHRGQFASQRLCKP